MSMHAQMSDSALAQLQKQQRNNTITSIIISILIVTLLGVIFFWILMPSANSYESEIVAYRAPQVDKEAVQEPKIVRPIQNAKVAPPAASAAVASVIAVSSATNISIPVPEKMVMTESSDFGNEISFDAAGWGGAIEVPKFDSVFGSTATSQGGLRGSLYDFKQNRRRKAVKYSGKLFDQKVLDIVRKKFSRSSLSDFFKAPQDLYLSSLAVSNRSAKEAPKFFGAEKDITPKGWIAHYKGEVTVPETGRYRFIGKGDDYISVLVDGKTVLIACWDTLQPVVADGWKASEDSEKWDSPFSRQPLIHGSWLDLTKGQKVQMDLTIGERPGGMLGFILLVEKEGVKYKKDKKGRPILPIFTTHAFSSKRKHEIKKDFGKYEFDWKNVPVFSTK